MIYEISTVQSAPHIEYISAWWSATDKLSYQTGSYSDSVGQDLFTFPVWGGFEDVVVYQSTSDSSLRPLTVDDASIIMRDFYRRVWGAYNASQI